MNAFESLLGASPEDKRSRGLEHTPREIAQQSAVWTRTAEMLVQRKTQVAQFLANTGLAGSKNAELILTGAGSSEFVGNAVAPALQKSLNRKVTSISTTNIVTHPDIFVPGNDYVVLSFARSGNSPESMATYNLVKQVCPAAKQIAITCNKEGALAKAAGADENSLYLELPEETNDKSLVMTSSFTTMALTALGLGHLNDPAQFTAVVQSAATAAQRILHDHADTIKSFADQLFTRACFLGSGTLNGTMQECHLKLQEMTEGHVVSMFNSFVGLRHGPQVFVNKDAVVIAALSSNPYVRRYEIDMLKELKSKKQGRGTLIICDKASPELRTLSTAIVELFPDGNPLPDDFRVLTDTVVGQVLGTFACLRCNLKPDNPSTSGTITRVVQGVTIYPFNP